MQQYENHKYDKYIQPVTQQSHIYIYISMYIYNNHNTIHIYNHKTQHICIYREIYDIYIAYHNNEWGNSNYMKINLYVHIPYI